MEWEEAQFTAEKFVEKYLSEGKYRETLKTLHGVGVGFTDGDITILYQNENSTASKKDMPVYDKAAMKEKIEATLNDFLKTLDKNADQ